MRVFNALCQAFDCHQIASDPGRDIRQVRKCRDDVNLILRRGRSGGQEGRNKNQPTEEIVQSLSHVSYSFRMIRGYEPSLFALAETVTVTSQKHGPLEEELIGVLGVPAVRPVVLQPQPLKLAGEPREI